MASQTESPVPAPTAQVVASAFVEQYYTILHQSPELVFRFYQEQSMLSHPGPNGDMISVTTMEAINDKILSLNSKDFKVELRTVDAQDSYQRGVTVLVTGWHIAVDEGKRKFIQSFFLAPQDKGYFVLNDVFRYVDDDELLENSTLSANNVIVDGPGAPLNPDQDTAPPPDHHVPVVEPPPSVSEEEVNNGEVQEDQTEETTAVEEDVVTDVPPSQNEVHPVVETTTMVPEDAPKKSYASIVKVMKESKAYTPVNVPTSTVRAAPAATEKQPLATVAPASEAPPPTTTSIPESSAHHEEAESHSIYIKSLPLNILDSQLEEEFKKFGPIKPGGVQVRSNKQGFCFGFVEFESSSSVRSAIEASPVIIGGKQAYVEEKRATSRSSGGGGGRGQFSSGRGASSSGFRSDSFRARTNFGGRGSFGRNDFTRGSEYGGRGRGQSRREGYQRVDQNGRGGPTRSSGGSNGNPVSA